MMRIPISRIGNREEKMELVNPHSLAETVDAINEAFFYGKPLSKADRDRTAKWIADRQGLPRSYAGMFAPTDLDYKNGVKLFTGEKVSTGAATGHILGEEASRALILLGVNAPEIRQALSRAGEGILSRLASFDRIAGTYCCGTCTCSYWRHLAAGGLRNAERELAAGIGDLKRHRDGAGRWRRYPFYYALLALSEIDLTSAARELRYAGPVLERLAARTPRGDKYGIRRRDLVERVLDRI
jgi:hypothetical protein